MYERTAEKTDCADYCNRYYGFVLHCLFWLFDSTDIARENVKRAGMQDHIRIFRRDVLKITKEDRRATIVCNPPYGERLLELRLLDDEEYARILAAAEKIKKLPKQ